MRQTKIVLGLGVPLAWMVFASVATCETRFAEVGVFNARLPNGVAWSPTGHKLALLDNLGLVVADPAIPREMRRIVDQPVRSFDWRLDSKLLVCRIKATSTHGQPVDRLLAVSLEQSVPTRVLAEGDIGQSVFDERGTLHYWDRTKASERTITTQSTSSPNAAPSRRKLPSLKQSPGLFGIEFEPGAPHSGRSTMGSIAGRRSLFLDAFPDGIRFLVAAEAEKDWHTYIVNSAGEIIDDLGPRIPGAFAGYSVSTSGDQILGVIVRESDDTDQSPQKLAIQSVDGKQLEVIRGVSNASYPQFSRDGSYVAFLDPSSGRTHVGSLTQN